METLRSNYPYGIFDHQGILVANFKTEEIAKRCVHYFGNTSKFIVKKYI